MDSPGRTPSATRRLAFHGLLWPAVLLAAIAMRDVARNPPPPDYRPVVRPSALDAWPAAAPGPASECVGRARRFIVVGWDGASWDLLLPLVEAGRMPNLAKLLATGASGDLAGFQPSLSPVLWTTVATGVSPDRHGILGFDKRPHLLLRRLERIRRLGRVRRELYTNADRRAPALWNMASEAGRSVLVVGYHNTYPAERVAGMMVSNYLVQAYVRSLVDANEPPDPAFAASLVYPPERTAEVLEAEAVVDGRLAAEIPRFAAFDAAGVTDFLERSRTLGPDGDRRMYFLRESYIFDTFHAQVATTLYPELRPDLLMVHFQAIDLISHYFLVFHDPGRYRDMPWSAETFEELERLRPLYGGTVGAIHEYLDEWLGRILALRDDDTAVVLLSDHGFEAESDPARGGHHGGSPPGILVAQGPGIAPGARIEGATIYDILPTLLTALDLPVATDLPGRPLREMFCAEAWASFAHRRIDGSPGGERYVPHIAPPPRLTAEIEAELKSLGYVR